MKVWQSVTMAGLVVWANISPATAASYDAVRIALSVDVPLKCNVEVGGAAAWSSLTTLELGSLQQFCNAPNGYVLHLDYAADTLEGATLRVGNDIVTLSGDGSDTLANSAAPARFDSDLSLSVSQSASVPSDLRFVIAAKT